MFGITSNFEAVIFFLPTFNKKHYVLELQRALVVVVISVYRFGI